MYLDQLLTTWEKLGPREKKILATLAARLYKGQRLHGELTVEKKDWTYEALEEVLDQSIYMACALNDKAEKAFEAMVQDAEVEVEQNYKGIGVDGARGIQKF